MKIADLVRGQDIFGLVPNASVELVSVSPISSDAVTVIVKEKSGQLLELIVTDDMEFSMSESSSLTFDGDPASFKLAMEAKRMELAGVFDPFVALSTSNLRPLPHQLSAVYGELINKVPLRFLLADEPGAGKTIMAGLLVKELILRGLLKRCLIVCPGSLGDQWAGELKEKFGLNFRQVTKSGLDESDQVNPFHEANFLIARMDQLARAGSDVQQRLLETEWDLVIIDEAHRMSAHQVGTKNDFKRTKRFQLGQTLSKKSTHFLMMTATPHSGSDENFHLFLSLLDGDMFSGSFRRGESKTDASPVMLRRIKENLVTMEGKPLFPFRKAITVAYDLSETELGLYEAVTDYVRGEMARAASLANKDKRQQGNVSFALTILQRRLASSPLAIFNSLQRRLARLEAVAEGGATTSQFNLANSVDLDLRDDVGGDLPDDELEDIQEGEAVDGASASTTTAELLQETASLKNLVVLAKAVLDSEMDTKWLELKGILQSEHMLNGKDGEFEKLIIFTEHRDTLEYLRRRVTETLGKNYKVITIHGGHSRDERRRSQTEFTHNPIAPILIGTDAAGEGINLQRAHFMVNYDLPWNPNRIEQRFGRIHRIGQASECTLWNLVSSNTREGSVYKRLLEKITTQGQAYNGNLFHILGGEELFEGRSLSDLLLDAIANEGHDSNKVLDAGFAKADAELQAASALVPEVVSSFDSSEIARRMNEAKSRRLAPGFVAGFFQEAFKDLGGVLQTKEPERYKIANVPSSLSKLSRQDQSIGDLSSQYERVTFRPENVELTGAPDAELVAPGAPLMNAVVRAILDKHGFNLAQGAIFLDENTVESDDSRLLVCLTQELVNNFDQTKPIERLVTFVEVSKSGDVQFHDTPPFFDLLLPEKNELEDLARLALAALDLPQLMEAGKTALSQRTISKRLPDLKREVGEQLDRTLVEVRKRMDQEVKYWKNEAKAISQGTRSNSDWSAAQAANKANELLGRRDARMDQIGREKMILAKPVQVVSVALVVPSSLAKGSDPAPVMTPREQEAIIRVERRAVDFVLRVESALGADPIEMPRNNKGFDISTLREETGRTFIEVKGRAVDATDFIITESEFSFGHTQGQSFILALVSVAHGDDAAQDEVRYIVDPFKGQAPIWGAHAHVLRFKDYWEKGFDPNF